MIYRALSSLSVKLQHMKSDWSVAYGVRHTKKEF